MRANQRKCLADSCNKHHRFFIQVFRNILNNPIPFSSNSHSFFHFIEQKFTAFLFFHFKILFHIAFLFKKFQYNIIEIKYLYLSFWIFTFNIFFDIWYRFSYN
ncbi:Uncharacterised protein [Mycobacteroides abscessus subsp. abscessus]|nr:Uncharacterised protein [Mycobacteroides abscessus subsp. abscessus]